MPFVSPLAMQSRIMSHKDADGESQDGHDGNADANAAVAAEEDQDQPGSDRESFFQCVDTVEPSGAARADVNDADSEFPSGEDEDGDADVRVSFATAVGDRLHEEQAELDEEEEGEEEEDEEEDMSWYDYGMWLAADEPVPIKERRRRLLQGMGLTSSRDLLRSRNARAARCASRRLPQPPAGAGAGTASTATAAPAVAAASDPEAARRHPCKASLTRCRSDSRLAVRGGAARKPPPSFRRVLSVPHSLHGSPVHKALRPAARCPSPSAASKRGGVGNGAGADIGLGGLTMRNLDGGKEFAVSGRGDATTGAGARGVVNDPNTGVQLSVDELEKFIGYTPLVEQLMRRSQSQPVPAAGAAKGGEKPGKRKTRWLKNIKLVTSAAAGLIHEKDRSSNPPSSASAMSKSASANAAMAAAPPPSKTAAGLLKVHHYGKSRKDLTGLYMRQEVRAHEGSIWSIKFSSDGRLLASGGEDRVVRVWQVVDADASSSPSLSRELSAAQLPPLHPADGHAASPGLAATLSRKVRRRGGSKSSKHVLPEHVVVPDALFALADKPACVFEGHLDDVLDLSWSKSRQRLLSSSMDKTVRLWDVETKSCLKRFAHNDYVTCIQFNPADDGYFISGSLDTKVRIWSVADRHVVDWSDLNDMVTAACYTPDGQAAIVGSHRGSCRFYKTRDCKLNQEAQIDMNISKKRKSQAKKITGFQFAPGNPSEILVTSADSQIRVFNGITVLQKFKGFKNTSSQISASYSGDGRYVVCASEDSHVYVWRRAMPGGGVGGGGGGGGGGGIGIGGKAKTWLTSRSYEYFYCRDVSAAVPWPGSPSFRRAASTAADDGDGRSPSSFHGKKTEAAVTALPRRPKSGPMTYPGVQADLLRRGASSGRHEGGNAWGMVMVTASLGGEIRVYQNFGLPLGIKGQSNLFH